jgi:hypothetical protein
MGGGGLRWWDFFLKKKNNNKNNNKKKRKYKKEGALGGGGGAAWAVDGCKLFTSHSSRCGRCTHQLLKRMFPDTKHALPRRRPLWLFAPTFQTGHTHKKRKRKMNLIHFFRCFLRVSGVCI